MASTTSGNHVCPFVEVSFTGALRLAEANEVGVDDVVYDLGSGKGRIMKAVLRRHPCRGVAIEINPALAKEASWLLKYEFGDRVKVVASDIREYDLSGATLVVSYLNSVALSFLKHHIAKSMRPGVKFVNYMYEVPGWTPSVPPVNGVYTYIISPKMNVAASTRKASVISLPAALSQSPYEVKVSDIDDVTTPLKKRAHKRTSTSMPSMRVGLASPNKITSTGFTAEPSGKDPRNRTAHVGDFSPVLNDNVNRNILPTPSASLNRSRLAPLQSEARHGSDIGMRSDAADCLMGTMSKQTKKRCSKKSKLHKSASSPDFSSSSRCQKHSTHVNHTHVAGSLRGIAVEDNSEDASSAPEDVSVSRYSLKDRVKENSLLENSPAPQVALLKCDSVRDFSRQVRRAVMPGWHSCTGA